MGFIFKFKKIKLEAETYKGEKMNAEKVLLPIIVIMLFGFTRFNSKDIYQQNKYNKTTYNFPYTNPIKYTDIISAIEFVKQLTEGNVIKAEMKFKKDLPVWIIYATGNSNNTFIVELSCEDNTLLRIDADEGPFEYELNPGKNFISFSESKKIAEEYTGIKTLKWRFLKNKNRWEYNFWLFLKSGRAQVRINAETGEIISTKKKK